ncbi:MAG: cell division protein FtsA [Candidatus Marinimicrobia bacterium]|nr:cell division protein FtsA [Candidatus Neomarinimicrobiota bacterium]OUW50613.1 MAG: cell division protein FtsA [bacterium TMED190]
MKIKNTLSNNICVGIDIGTTKICCVVGEVDLDNIEILGIGVSNSNGVKKGSVIDIDKTINSIEDAVNKAEKMSGKKISEATVGISGDHISSMSAQGAIAISKGQPISDEEEISKLEVEQVLNQARSVSLPSDRQILHLIPQEFVIDQQHGIKNPIGMVGRRLEANFHLISCDTSASKNIKKCVEEAGIKPLRIVYQSLGSAASVLEKHEKDLGVVLIDIGGGTTDICIFFEGEVRHSAVIGLGGNNISNDIAAITQISKYEAELIKRNYGSAKANMVSDELNIELKSKGDEKYRKESERQISNYIEARMTEIFNMVNNEIQKANIKSPYPLKIVLTGGGSLLKNSSILAQEIFNSKVKIGIPKGLNKLDEIKSSPIYSTGIGLINYPELVFDDSKINRKIVPNGISKGVTNIIEWFKEFF